MVEFKCVVNDPKQGRSYGVKVTGHHANSLVGKRIGNEVDGIFVDLPGYKLKITGGTDKDGFPMRGDLPGIQRRRVLVAGGIGFRPVVHGQRRRKTMRGDTVTLDCAAINLLVVRHGSKPVGDILKDAAAKAEASAKGA